MARLVRAGLRHSPPISIERRLRASPPKGRKLCPQFRGFALVRNCCAGNGDAITYQIAAKLSEVLRGRFSDLLSRIQVLENPSAVAMGYYHFVIALSVLRMNFPQHVDRIDVSIFLDRFPGATGARDERPELSFLKFLDRNSVTGSSIREDEENRGIFRRLAELQYWRPHNARADEAPKRGKMHPHFTLVDWFVASAIAERFPESFVACYKPARLGDRAVAAMRELFNEFKECGPIVSLADDNTLHHLIGGAPQWEMPDDARDFIMRRATNIQ